jgi:SAM-dependent methyltransferase
MFRYIIYLISCINFIIYSSNKKKIYFILLIIINFLYTQLLFQLLYKKKYKKIKQNYKSYINTNKFILKNKEWFLNNIPFWYHLLKKNKLFEKKLQILEIGSYMGNSTIFFLKYLTNSKIICVDTFKGGLEHQNNKYDFNYIYKSFKKNMKIFEKRYKLFKMESQKFFEKKRKKVFDIIYIDGSHEYKDVLMDAKESYKILKRNGFLIFDDYLFNFNKKIKNPINAINDFMVKNLRNFKIVYIYHQIIIKKIK